MNGRDVTRWIQVRTHASMRTSCFPIGASQAVQSDRRNLCRDNPFVETLIPPSHTQRDTHLEKHAHTVHKQTNWGLCDDMNIWKWTEAITTDYGSDIRNILSASATDQWTDLCVYVCMYCVCVFNLSLYLSCAHQLSITYFPSSTPFFLSLLSPFQSLILHVLVLITNSAVRKGSRRYRALVSLQRAKPNDHIGTQIHKQEPVWQRWVPVVALWHELGQ